MTTLIVGPILAATLVAASQPKAGHPTTPAVSDAQTMVRIEVRSAPLAVAESLRAQAPPPATPAPTPAPTLAPKPKPPAAVRPVAVAPADPNSIIGIIQAAAARWGVSGSWMVSIARCESGLRPTAVNPSGPYRGLFQFLQSTFTHNGGTDIWSATDQSNIAAKMLAHGQAHQWSCA
ncbi:MAG TPA: transglycosylase SLT domain-containing protein [Candidatus Dormibacteraeota bacterium]|jgi:soluble lytic murein transglycosylase-like protein